MSLRPRGFITDWRPRADTLELLDQVQAVLEEYRDLLPLALRQIFYRLVGAYFYEKTERAYKRLTEALNKARRARVIAMDAIRDDGFTSKQPLFYNSVENCLRALRTLGAELRLDRQRGQARRLVIMCEAIGMVPQLARIADPFGIEVCSSGGFDSVTDKHQLGKLWASAPHTVLHIGDYDRSGVPLFDNLREDVNAFAAAYGGEVEFVRLAITKKQAERYNLPSAPAKETDRRRLDIEETWQAEALDPRTLAAIVAAAIEERIDRALYEAVLEEEEEARQDVLSRLGDV